MHPFIRQLGSIELRSDVIFTVGPTHPEFRMRRIENAYRLETLE